MHSGSRRLQEILYSTTLILNLLTIKTNINLKLTVKTHINNINLSELKVVLTLVSPISSRCWLQENMESGNQTLIPAESKLPIPYPNFSDPKPNINVRHLTTARVTEGS